MVDRLCYSWVLLVIIFSWEWSRSLKIQTGLCYRLLSSYCRRPSFLYYIYIYKLLVLSVCWCPLVFVHFFGATCATGNLACCCSSPLAASIFCKVQTRRCFQISHHADRSSSTVNVHIYVCIYYMFNSKLVLLIGSSSHVIAVYSKSWY